ncbi:hypothetical protein GCM10022237_06820 [Nocardioides ginsengisoli]|uniref:Uncharacterized protein n=1 Tax=Nocardioides ginsengisoli TaxID=363868 RepID=A0ABW3VVC0_9ACTN
MEQSLTSSAANLGATLLRLARREEELAADEAAAIPYWSSCPLSVVVHRAAAALLRAEAQRFGV